jgi:3-oxoacyl-[acyl-carrier-protein] synthase II
MTETKATRPGPAEVWITGIGLATSLGEGLDANWQALAERRINVDKKTFAPYVVHPFAPVNFDTQIPKRGDQRQMESWQRIGTYAAGLALDSAGVKGNKEILSRMDMIVAAGGGERDLAVDEAILTTQAKGNVPPGFLNERLMSDLRPTLFLAQLSNLLAGNIAIVHGVTGTSRTFMGEETAAVDAARIALARIVDGESDIALIGGAQNGERKDLLVLYEFGGFNLKDHFAPLWARTESPGFALGSAGAFIVLESRAHAEARGAKPFARLTQVVGDHAPRKQPGQITQSLESLWGKLKLSGETAAVITGATGAEPATSEERAFLASHKHAIRATATMFGHTMEAQFPIGLALAALSISRGGLFPPNDSTGFEIEMSTPPSQIVVVGTGHWRGEGMALVEAVK